MGLSKRYGPVQAVTNVSFTVEQGSLLSLVGPSGCGKTTTLRLIAGLETPDSGTITIGGSPVAGASAFVPPERRRVGLVFQDYALFPHMTVSRNIAYGLENGQANQKRVDEVMEMVGLSRFSGRYPHELSGGEQQRVALARALAPKPVLVLLDEPFSNLDTALRTRVRSEVKRILRDAGTASIIVTHDQDEALSLADQAGVMLNGRIVQMGAPEEVYGHPTDMEVATFLGNANVLDGIAGGGSVECEIGTLPTHDDITGAVHVIIRPEMLHVREAPEPDAHGIVVEREFYGHDQVIVVQLRSGHLLRSRCGPEVTVQRDESVRLNVLAPVSAFPSS
jgi:iron(III) transport system ATP-binding protein